MRSDEPSGVSWMRRGSHGGGGKGGPSPLAIIMWANIAVFILQFGFELMWEYVVVSPEIGRQWQPWGATSSDLVFRQGQVWRLFTYMFVHGGFLHILLNLVFIYVCGRAVLAIAGRKHFLRVYILSGLLGGLLQMALSSGSLVGASACAFGLLAALAAIIPDQQVTVLLYFILPVRLRLKYLAYALVGISLVSMLIDFAAGPEAKIPMVTGIGHAAHLGGALMGWLYVRATGLGGVRVTRETLMRNRQRAERAADRKGRRPKRAEVLSSKSKGDSFVSAEIDPILDKINREGFASLTDKEKEILESGSKEISDRANSK